MATIDPALAQLTNDIQFVLKKAQAYLGGLNAVAAAAPSALRLRDVVARVSASAASYSAAVADLQALNTELGQAFFTNP